MEQERKNSHLMTIGVALAALGVLLQQTPASFLDSATQSYAVISGKGHLLFSLGSAFMAVGAAVIGAALVLRRLTGSNRSASKNHPDAE